MEKGANFTPFYAPHHGGHHGYHDVTRRKRYPSSNLPLSPIVYYIVVTMVTSVTALDPSVASALALPRRVAVRSLPAYARHTVCVDAAVVRVQRFTAVGRVQ